MLYNIIDLPQFYHKCAFKRYSTRHQQKYIHQCFGALFYAMQNDEEMFKTIFFSLFNDDC